MKYMQRDKWTHTLLSAFCLLWQWAMITLTRTCVKMNSHSILTTGTFYNHLRCLKTTVFIHNNKDRQVKHSGYIFNCDIFKSLETLYQMCYFHIIFAASLHVKHLQHHVNFLILHRQLQDFIFKLRNTLNFKYPPM